MDWAISVVFMPRAYAGSHCSERNQQEATARVGLLVVDRSVVKGKGRSGDKVKRWARPPESAAFGAARRSLRTASAGRAAGRGASTATPPGGRGPLQLPIVGTDVGCGVAAVEGRRSQASRFSETGCG